MTTLCFSTSTSNRNSQSFLVFVRYILLPEFQDFGRIPVVPKLLDTSDKIGVIMKISRETYLEKLIAAKGDGYVKVVTGIRRCGKSYLLFSLFW